MPVLPRERPQNAKSLRRVVCRHGRSRSKGDHIMTHISTHVLDATSGRPAAGVPVTLTDAGGQTVEFAITDTDGRVRDLHTGAAEGVYTLTFDTAAYFGAQGVTGFYPKVAITFEIADTTAKYHVPLLLSPYAYSTYRGS